MSAGKSVPFVAAPQNGGHQEALAAGRLCAQNLARPRDLMRGQEVSELRVDVGILTIREDEFRAVLAAFPEKVGTGIHRGRREYAIRSASAGPSGTYTVAILRQAEQGNGEAQDAARDMIDDFGPSLLLVVGIAGGVPSDDFTLGDVVISTRIHEFSLEQRKFNEEASYSSAGGPIAKGLAAAIANLAAREGELGSWADGLPAPPKVPQKPQTYGPEDWQESLKKKLKHHFPKGASGRKPLYTAGPIGSSDRLIKDPTVLLPWLSTARHLLAVEMESAGVYRAARERCPMIAIRGISDLVGLHRQESWTKYACAAAANFARAFLGTQPVPAPASGPSQNPAVSTVQSPNTVYANLVPLFGYPKSLFVAPALVGSFAAAWASLKSSAPQGVYIPRCWVLFNKNVFTFYDPRTSSGRLLAPIADTGAVEEHSSSEWAQSQDPSVRHLFVQLISRALQDDLRASAIRFNHRDDIYYFEGWPDEPSRKQNYKNVKVRSTITTVAHYETTSKNGSVYRYLRHQAFSGNYRNLAGAWYLEVVPTYFFSSDGHNKYRFHDALLSGIKRLEGNRAVLSQLLLWNDVLAASAGVGVAPRLLRFGLVPSFGVDLPISDDVLVALNDRGEEVAPATEGVDQ